MRITPSSIFIIPHITRKLNPMIAYHYSYWDKRENTWPTSEIHPEIRVQLSYKKASALTKDNRSHVWLSRLIMQRANQKPERESTSIFVISVEKDLETPVTMDVFFHFLGTEFWRDYTLTSPYTRPVKLLSTQCFHGKCFAGRGQDTREWLTSTYLIKINW